MKVARTNLKAQVAIERTKFSASNLKAQVATEFMLYTAIFMFITIAAFVVVNQMMSTEIPLQQNTVAKETGEAFANAILLSVKGGNGFSYNYTFPRTLFGLPYTIYLTNLSDGFMILEWEGNYGNFSYSYSVPSYEYNVDGACLTGGVLMSDTCSNVLMLNNVHGNLTINQMP
ncbi:hypothetical protein KKB44_06405 [Candidatus Micrarchaeota archaeon]|nr:hypothetical protein [Candidatus Micrarchaeota archaeon]